jgi:hypothetical protein
MDDILHAHHEVSELQSGNRPARASPVRGLESETDRGLYTEVRREHYKEASARAGQRGQCE